VAAEKAVTTMASGKEEENDYLLFAVVDLSF